MSLVLFLLAVPRIAAADEEVLYVLHQGEGLVLALNPQTLDVEARIELTAAGQNFVATPDGRRLYAPDRHGLAVIDTFTNEIIDTVDLPSASRATSALAASAAVASSSRAVIGVSPNGAFVYALAFELSEPTSSIQVVSTATNTVVRSIELPHPYPTTTAVTPDGSSVLVPFFVTSSLVRVSTATNEIVGESAIAGAANYGNIAFTPDGARAFVCTTEGLIGLDAESFEVVSVEPLVLGCQGIAIRPDGAKLYFGSPTNQIGIYDLATNVTVAAVSVAPHPRGLALSGDGARLFVSNTESDLLSVIDTASEQVVMTENVGSAPTDLALVSVPPPTTAASGGGCAMARPSTLSPWPLLLALLAFAQPRRALHRNSRCVREVSSSPAGRG